MEGTLCGPLQSSESRCTLQMQQVLLNDGPSPLGSPLHTLLEDAPTPGSKIVQNALPRNGKKLINRMKGWILRITRDNSAGRHHELEIVKTFIAWFQGKLEISDTFSHCQQQNITTLVEESQRHLTIQALVSYR